MFKFKHLLLGIGMLAFFSCGSTGKKVKETTSSLSSLKKMAKEAKNSEKNYKDLANATPLTNDQIKAWMPEELDNLRRDSYTVGGAGMLGMSSLNATYANEDKSKRIEFQLIDGADSIGAGMITMFRMTLAADMEQETQSEVQKTVTKNGRKAFVVYQKDKSSCSIKFIENNRFYIDLEGKNLSIDELWDVVGELKLNKLGK